MLEIATAGQPLSAARGAMILVHGRGSTSHSILQLARDLHHDDLAYLAPQAAGFSWYPYSFLFPLAQNEPGLSAGLAALANVLEQVKTAGISSERIIIGGFSQGACLAAEFVARHAQHAERLGGLIVFSGGLIGPPGTPRDYPGSLNGTPVFIGCGDNDSHIPVARVEETAAVFEQLGAAVIYRIYPGLGHTIVPDEIDHAQRIVQAVMESH